MRLQRTLLHASRSPVPSDLTSRITAIMKRRFLKQSREKITPENPYKRPMEVRGWDLETMLSDDVSRTLIFYVSCLILIRLILRGCLRTKWKKVLSKG